MAKKGKAKQETRKEEPKATYTLPAGEDALAKVQAGLEKMADAFKYTLGAAAEMRGEVFEGALTLVSGWPTVTNREAFDSMRDMYYKDLPKDMSRPVSGAIEKALLIARGCDFDKVQGGIEGVKATLATFGWNAAVQELRKAKAMAEASPRQRKAQKPKAKSGEGLVAGTNSIPLSEPAEAVRQMTHYCETFVPKHFGNGYWDVLKNPVLARSFVTLAETATKHAWTVKTLLERLATEKATGKVPHTDIDEQEQAA